MHARHEEIVRITLVRWLVVPVTLVMVMVVMVGRPAGQRRPASRIVVHVRIVWTRATDKPDQKHTAEKKKNINKERITFRFQPPNPPIPGLIVLGGGW